MTIFRVGQRVRVKYCEHPEKFGDLSGHEGVVTGHCMARTVRSKIVSSYTVLVDGLPAIRSDGAPYIFIPDQLEPLTDSYDLVSWESMRDLWVPEHLMDAA